MKKAITAILCSCAILGCSSSKKTTETTERISQDTEAKAKEVTQESMQALQQAKSEQNADSSSIETKLVYTPIINQQTGLYEPFKMKAGNSTVEINGNGQVEVRTLESKLSKSETDFREHLNTQASIYESAMSEKETTISEKEQEITQRKSSVLRLWIVIIILSLALAASLYRNFRK